MRKQRCNMPLCFGFCPEYLRVNYIWIITIIKMKFINRLLIGTLVLSAFASCSSDDDTTDELMGENSITLEFDNAVGSDDLILATSSYTNSQNETLTITRLNYIVSNFRLTNNMGEVFTYEKDDSYFVTSEETGNT